MSATAFWEASRLAEGRVCLRSGRKSDAVFNERDFGDCFSLRNWVYYRGPFYRNPPPPPTTGAFGFLNFNQSGDRPDRVARAWPLQDDTLRSELAGVPEDDIALRVLLVDARRAGSSVGCWQALPCAPRSAWGGFSCGLRSLGFFLERVST